MSTDPRNLRERLALTARIQRQFAIVTDRVQVAPDVGVDFARPADPEAVLDAACAAEDDIRAGRRPPRVVNMPYWAAVWESAAGVGGFLAERCRDEIAGRTLLDLGCGTGLAGAICAAIGGRVTLADYESPALLFARLNTLPWRCRTRRCDWQSDDLGERFDVIVGSDILYEVPQWPFVEAFCRRHLAPGGTLYLGEPGRPRSEPFPDWARGHGWSVDRAVRTVGPRSINVLTLAR